MTTTTDPDPATASTTPVERSSPVGPVQMIAGAVVCLVGALAPWTTVSGSWLHDLRSHGLGPGPVKPTATLVVLVLGSVALGALGVAQLRRERHSQLVGGAGAMLSVAMGLVWVFRLGPAQYFVQYVPAASQGTGAVAWGFWLVPAGAIVGVVGSLWSVPGAEDLDEGPEERAPGGTEAAVPAGPPTAGT